jgi:hypothetical protein
MFYSFFSYIPTIVTVHMYRIICYSDFSQPYTWAEVHIMNVTISLEISFWRIHFWSELLLINQVILKKINCMKWFKINCMKWFLFLKKTSNWSVNFFKKFKLVRKFLTTMNNSCFFFKKELI